MSDEQPSQVNIAITSDEWQSLLKEIARDRRILEASQEQLDSILETLTMQGNMLRILLERIEEAERAIEEQAAVDTAYNNRVIVLEGDIARIESGLSPKEKRRINLVGLLSAAIVATAGWWFHKAITCTHSIEGGETTTICEPLPPRESLIYVMFVSAIAATAYCGKTHLVVRMFPQLLERLAGIPAEKRENER